MPNNYFQFKQFTVQQDTCAMKVCTDACLFGALAARGWATGMQGVENCLDIGTGTGLLSLMYAQQNQRVLIDAVEIDGSAAEQAATNFASSPWNNRLHVFNTDILNFVSEKKYGLIISNPPFFENDLKSPDRVKNHAKHDTSLSLIQLAESAKAHVSSKGLLAVLLPYHRIDYFTAVAADNNFHLQQQILVKQTGNHDFFRGILFFGLVNIHVHNAEIIIKNDDGNYSDEFADALKDYYLNL